MNKRCVIDIETNGLLSDIIDFTSFPYKKEDNAELWVISILDCETKKITKLIKEEITKERLEKELRPYSTIIGHNIIKFDLVALRLFEVFDYFIGFPGDKDLLFGREVRFIDTIILARLLDPGLPGGHSLDAWGKRIGEFKTDFRQVCIDKGYMKSTDPKGFEFSFFSQEMVDYCDQDVIVGDQLFSYLEAEMSTYPYWNTSVLMEHKLADLAIKRESVGFWFDKDLALELLEDLTNKMEELRDRVNPLLPPKRMGKTESKKYIPPKIQLTKAGEPSKVLLNFAERVGGAVEKEEDFYVFKIEREKYKIPFTTQVKTHVEADIKDLDHVKEYLIHLGWDPTEWAERDLTKDSKKQYLSQEKRKEALDRWFVATMEGKYKEHRLEVLEGKTIEEKYSFLLRRLEKDFPVRIRTSPKVRVGVAKDLCSNLEILGEKVDFAKDFTLFLTYKHRKSTIAGGDIEDMDFDEEAPEKGYLSMYREKDGRIPTPAIEIGANCVVRDTEVITFEGIKKIVDVKLDDEVLTHEGIYARVTDLINNGIKPVYKLTTSKGFTITCTENHPFMTQHGWVKLKDLDKETHILRTYGKKEIWGKHPIFKNYNISSFGRILDKTGKELKGVIREGNYAIVVDLYDGEGNKTRRGVGKIVCETFNGLCPEGLETRHLDGNPFNNNIQNLKFGTSKENSEDINRHRQSRRDRRKTTEKITDQEVEQIREYFKINGYKKGDDTFFSKKYNIGREYFGEIRRGIKRKIHDSYKEDFEEDRIESITYEGEQPTFDITVRKYHSYVANSIVTHNTGRYRHIGVCNVPRASSIYGKEMRSLFGAGNDFVQFGFDFASLEARIQSHYCWHYTDGQALSISLLAEKPNDLHTKTAQNMGVTRDEAKSINYMLMYGGSSTKAQSMLGVSKERADEIVEKFWDSVPSLKEFRDVLEGEWKSNNQEWVSAIDGRKLNVRSRHSLVNLIFQSGGVIAAKFVTILIAKKFENLGLNTDPFKGKPDVMSVIEYHDECQLIADPKLLKFKSFETEEDAKTFVKEWEGEQLSDISFGKRWYVTLPSSISKIIDESIQETVDFLKLNVNLGYAYAVSDTWYGCH